MALRKNVALFAIVAVALLVGTGIAAAAVTIVQSDPNRVAPAEGSVQGSDNLTIDSQSLSYSGVNATGMTVDVRNTGSVDHTGTVHLSVKTADGVEVETATLSSETFNSNTVSSVSYSFSQERPIDSFHSLEVLVEETG